MIKFNNNKSNHKIITRTQIVVFFLSYYDDEAAAKKYINTEVWQMYTLISSHHKNMLLILFPFLRSNLIIGCSNVHSCNRKKTNPYE
jgi:hypothetical protein